MKKYHAILILIFLMALSFRLYFVFQTPYYSSDDAYFHIRYVEHLSNNLRPFIHDDLSYGGRTALVSPLFHYFLTIFYKINPVLAFKIVPEILLASLVFIVFIIAKRITKDTTSALLSSLISGFLPIFIFNTTNKISIYSLVLVLLFYSIYCLLDIQENISIFLILAFILPILHPFGFVLGISFLLYIIFLNLDSINIKPLRKEAIILFMLISLLVNLIIFKKGLLSSGIFAVWQNIPTELQLDIFKNMDLLTIITSIGVIPLIFGVMGFFLGIFKNKKRSVYLLSAMALTMLLLLLFKLISFSIGVMFLGILLTIMSSLAFEKISRYLTLTKFHKFKKHICIVFVLLILISLGIPSYTNATKIISNSITQNEIEALTWAMENTPKEATILAGVNEGNLITAIAKRKNVLDDRFLLVENRYEEIKKAYTTKSLVIASQIMDKYDTDYFYVSKRAKKFYKIEEIIYLADENCFKQKYGNEEVEIYKIIC
ncbi:MAG: hypothetical protein U9Q69_05725 [Nanoarchaeota archaeon]|nr:hypothetical protein [Nanoarchaeota archaeon]